MYRTPIHLETIHIPRWVLASVAALCLFAFAVVGAARLSGADPTPMPHAPVTQSVVLTFEDRGDGSVLARDQQGAVHAVVAPETGGFVRGVLRALVRVRHQNGLGADAGGFALSRLADGQIILSDPATGEIIDLGAFGPTNQGAFVALMNGDAS